MKLGKQRKLKIKGHKMKMLSYWKNWTMNCVYLMTFLSA